MLRPPRCPYCGSFHTMKGNGTARRYFLPDPKGKCYTLRVPVYRCTTCGRSTRVLPGETHSHSVHSWNTIKTVLLDIFTRGHFRSGDGLSDTLKRSWVSRFRMRMQEESLPEDRPAEAVRLLPDFSMLYRKNFKTLVIPKSGFVFTPTKRHCSLIVCPPP